MNEAIRLAIEKGGYNQRVDPDYYTKAERAVIMLDPLFWQALGKALAWGYVEPEWLPHKNYPIGFHWKWDKVFYPHEHKTMDGLDKWQYYAHQYFDLLLTGGDTEKFWKELTKF